jgi:hypothetical protein
VSSPTSNFNVYRRLLGLLLVQYVICMASRLHGINYSIVCVLLQPSSRSKRSKPSPSSPESDLEGAYVPFPRSAPPSAMSGNENIFKGTFPQHQDSRSDLNASKQSLSSPNNLYEKVCHLLISKFALFCFANVP